jgi:hypothetical protein
MMILGDHSMQELDTVASIIEAFAIPIPLFDAKISIYQMNDLARFTRLRVIETVPGQMINDNETLKYQQPMVDGIATSPMKTNDMHDKNHFSSEETSPFSTQDVGRFTFENSYGRYEDEQIALHILYFLGWHERAWDRVNYINAEGAEHLELIISRMGWVEDDPSLQTGFKNMQSVLDKLKSDWAIYSARVAHQSKSIVSK